MNPVKKLIDLLKAQVDDATKEYFQAVSALTKAEEHMGNAKNNLEELAAINGLPISSRDIKIRNRALAYFYLLGKIATAQIPLDDYEHACIIIWRANAERLSNLLGRNLVLDLQDTSLHIKMWGRGK